jgi:nucleoside-diphosphate-sugar epimerase
MAVDILITGGAGFVGSNLAGFMLERDEAVRVLDDLSTGKRENLPDRAPGLEFMQGDIRDADCVARAVAGVRHVFHLAALPSVARSVAEPVLTNSVNVEGTLRLLLAARDAGVETFVYASSSSVYGDTEELPKHEAMRLLPLSPYAAQKAAGENYCAVFHRVHGLRTFALRFFNVFGPRQNPQSEYSAVIPAFTSALAAGRAPVIDGDGGQTRDFTYVEDVVRAMLCCREAPETAAGEVFNVACGNRISVNEVFRLLAEIMNTSVEAEHGPPRAGDVRDSQGAGEKAQRLLGWQPEVEFAEGLRRTAEWYGHGRG